MKKTLIALPLALLLVACGGEKQPASPSGTPDVQQPEKIAPSGATPVAMKTVTLDVTGMT